MAQGKSIRGQKEDARRAKRSKMRAAAGGAKPRKSVMSVVVLSLVTAGVGTALCVLFFRVALTMGAAVDPDLQNLIIMLGFIVFFLTAFLIFMKRYLHFDMLGGNSEPAYNSPSEKWGGALEHQSSEFAKVFDDADSRRVAEPISLDEQSSFTDMPDAVPPPPEEDGEAANSADAGQGPQGVGPGGPDVSEDSNSDGQEESGDSEDKIVSDETMAKVLDDLKYVIVEVSTVLQERGSKIDNFAKFGLNLFFAGVCSNLTKHFSLSAKEGQGLLARLMELTGADSQTARSFSDSINGYGEYPQHRKMIDAGDAFMASHFEDDGETGPNLGDTLDEWSEAEEETGLPATHVFMFTDILDGAALAKEVGGESMQDIVKTHNEIVREALDKFSGREVKDMGEGMMAIFDDPRMAIDAAVQMQQDTNLFSRQTPAKAFDIRIGLHVGEAINEGDDYFGNAVKTTALVCNEAGGEEIWVSDELWHACPYYADDLRYSGEFKLDGSDEDKMLYTMLWEPLPDPTKKGKVGYGEIGDK